ncbi:MAG: glycosyltransferase, partial [Oscillospiraceae bacterium]|nr:glycosyltransferase [Candidatus Equicaccousia limihippi]
IGNTLPAKLQEYMSGGRPVFASMPSAGRAVIEEAKCGVAVNDDDDEALASEMLKFIQDKEYLADAGENGRYYYENHFTRETFIGDLLVYFGKIIADRKK